MKKIIVLHIVNKMDRAGGEMLIMNIMRRIDREKFQFKFLVKTNEAGQFENEIKELGGEIYRIERWNGINTIRYKKQLDLFFSSHPEIDIVHAHQGSSAALDIASAKKHGMIAVAHSHNTYTNNVFNIKEDLFKLVSYRTRFIADAYIGCAKTALLSRFGKSIQKRKPCYILNNGIDVERFRFSLKKREKFRREHGLPESSNIYLFVGRLTKVKNPFFAVSVFKRLLEHDADSVLLIAGVGPLENKLKGFIKENKLEKSVILLGNIPNVDELYSAGDAFLMPSVHEGFPVTLVEAQCAGLPCFVSDRITREVELSDRISFLPIARALHAARWADTINSKKFDLGGRETPPEKVINGFSDIASVNSVVRIYESLLNHHVLSGKDDQ